MDSLAALDTQALSESGAWLTVVDVRGNKLDVRIRIAGQDSRLYQRALQEQVERFAKKRERNVPIPIPEVEESGLILLATITLDWENVTVDGKPLPCNYVNAINIYRRYPVLREQVTAFSTDRANYLTRVSESLQNGVAGDSDCDLAAPIVPTQSTSSVN